MDKRHGQASTQYGDLRGEAAADFFQDTGRNTDMQSLARELGWEGKGRVVGMELGLGERKPDETTLHCFYLTLQIVDQNSIEDIQREINDSDGTLLVREHMIDNVDILNIVKHLKRFEIGLFTKLLKPGQIEVIE